MSDALETVRRNPIRMSSTTKSAPAGPDRLVSSPGAVPSPSPMIVTMAGPSPAPHKPRRRAAKKPATERSVGSSTLAASSGSNGSRSGSKKKKSVPQEALVRTPSFPLAAFMWPARATVSQWETLPLILMITGLFRWAAGLWGYSGLGRPPMYGDYEAQRHWMEVTTQLPVSQWYFHDLEWWGLDYPPLTAYHSWLCGKIGSLIDPSWFALYTSRGSADTNLKIFMRATVLVSEFLIYVPAVAVFVRRFSRLNGVPNWSASVALVAILMQPGTILIDHVHFQYNTVMLGFVLASISGMFAGRYMWASVFFVAALGFKQMALYYAFSVFAYLLGSCVSPKINVSRFIGIGTVTLLSFAVLVAPIILGALYDVYRGIDARPDLKGPRPALPLFPELATYLDTKAFYYPVVEQLVQMVHRIFPFARGLFEDKVANFWCALNVVVKLRSYPGPLLQKAALGATLAAIIPPNLILFVRPRKTLLPLAFAATAWGFFLFSYQVHEKSVLLPLLPMTVLLAGRQGLGRDTRAWVGFGNMLGCWTMFPLLKRVDLAVPYAVLTLLWAYLLGLPPTSLDLYSYHEGSSSHPVIHYATAVVHCLFYLAMGLWHAAEAFVTPPPDKPDLWVVANVGIGAVGFGICYLWCLSRLLIESELLPQSWTAKKTKGKAL